VRGGKKNVSAKRAFHEPFWERRTDKGRGCECSPWAMWTGLATVQHRATERIVLRRHRRITSTGVPLAIGLRRQHHHAIPDCAFETHADCLAQNAPNASQAAPLYSRAEATSQRQRLPRIRVQLSSAAAVLGLKNHPGQAAAA